MTCDQPRNATVKRAWKSKNTRQGDRTLRRNNQLLAASLAWIAVLATAAAQAQPVNDDINAATVVNEPLPFTDAVSSVDATTAADDPDCFGNGPTVWYVYTPSASGPVSADTFGSDYDTTLSVYEGTPGSLVQIVCNDDSGTVQSRVVWEAAAGTSYYLMAGAYASGPGGALNFTVQPSAPPVTITEFVLEPVGAVHPQTGVALTRARLILSGPVFAVFADGTLQQRTGRGNVYGSGFKLIEEVTDSIDVMLMFTDSFGGKGFAGGPASGCIAIGYFDAASGFQLLQDCSEVILRGGR